MHEAETEYYTVEEVADELGLSVSSIRRRIRSGMLRAVLRPDEKIPGHGMRWVIPKSALGPREIVDVVPLRHDISLDSITAAVQRTIDERMNYYMLALKPTLAKVIDERASDITLEDIERVFTEVVSGRVNAQTYAIAQAMNQINELRKAVEQRNETTEQNNALIEQLTAEVIALKAEYVEAPVPLPVPDPEPLYREHWWQRGRPRRPKT